MTDAQLEAAARKLCAIRGIDPDDTSLGFPEPDESGFVEFRLVKHPAWRRAAGEIRIFYEVAQALDSVLGDGSLPGNSRTK